MRCFLCMERSASFTKQFGNIEDLKLAISMWKIKLALTGLRKLMTLLKNLEHKNSRITIRELADTLHKSVFIMHDHLKKLRFSIRLNVWMPHEMNEWQLERVNICDMQLQRNQEEPLLKRIITGDGS